MRREVDLKEISDGRLYGPEDMVKAGCGGCEGCSACCTGMGRSIVLDPMDACRLAGGLSLAFEALLSDRIELNLVDGVILPNIKMAGAGERCPFLAESGRCGIYSFRPGVCRLFPLGRYYENHSFRYFLQVHECRRENRTKVKVRKWIGIPGFKQYEQFVTDWHYFIKELQEQAEKAGDKQAVKEISMGVLRDFYFKAYEPEKDFYEQFYERLDSFTAQRDLSR